MDIVCFFDKKKIRENKDGAKRHPMLNVQIYDYVLNERKYWVQKQSANLTITPRKKHLVHNTLNSACHFDWWNYIYNILCRGLYHVLERERSFILFLFSPGRRCATLACFYRRVARICY